MRTNLKKRLAVFLTILFVLPTILEVLPQTATVTQAASKTQMYWSVMYTGQGTVNISVETGKAFYIGDYVSIYTGDKSSVASMEKAAYSSSNKAVASVTDKGYVTTRSAGDTKITVKYKGKMLTCKLTVVKAGEISGKSEYKNVSKLKKLADGLAAKIPSTVTTKNAYDFNKIYQNYIDKVSSTMSGISRDGVGNATYSSDSGRSGCELVVPEAGRGNYARTMLYNYADKYNPVSTISSKALKLKSVSSTTKKITVNFKSPVTTEHIYAANINDSYINEKPAKTKASALIAIYDKTDGDVFYTGFMQLKKGSKQAVIVLKDGYSKKVNGEWKYVYKTLSLKKGHTYQIGNKLWWGKGKTFTVK